ncbi:MAG: hypothetical protein ACR2O8_15505 [Rhizobiaceae bacterium]
MKVTVKAGLAILLASTVSASAGNYPSGAQLGGGLTDAQIAFYEDQLRISRDTNFLHEDDHRNGGTFIINMSRHMWYTMRNTMRYGYAPTRHYENTTEPQ